MHWAFAASTLIRVAIPLASAVGAFTAVVVALVKLLPERTAIAVDYTVEALKALREENMRQAQLIAYLEKEVGELRADRAVGA